MGKTEELGNWDGDVLIYNLRDGSICNSTEMVGDYIGIITLHRIGDGVFNRTDLKNTLPVQNEFRYNIDSFTFLLIRQGKLLACHLSLFGPRLDTWRQTNNELSLTYLKAFGYLVKFNKIKQLRKKIKRKLKWKRK